MPEPSNSYKRERRDSYIYAKTLSDLRALSDTQLVERHDELVGNNAVPAGVEYYLGEIQRRESARREGRMLNLTTGSSSRGVD